jgi:hypothetical protein
VVLYNVTHVSLPTKYFLYLSLELLVTLYHIACKTTVLSEVLNGFCCMSVIGFLREVQYIQKEHNRCYFSFSCCNV